MMVSSPDPLCALALGLTALLALRSDRLEEFGRAIAIPAWLPLAVLAVLAVGSGVLCLIDPESLAAALAES